MDTLVELYKRYQGLDGWYLVSDPAVKRSPSNN